MAGFVCPQCGSARITDGKCEYCGFIFEEKKPETPGISSSEQRTVPHKHLRRIGIVLLVIIAVVIGVSIWYNTSRHSMPRWLWNLVFDVRIFFGLRPF